MIITRNWLQDFIDISQVSTQEICNTLNSIGLEVDSVSKVTVPSGVVVGKVVEKEKHPNADKLSVCKVDVGKEILQIVCGAKNVQKGQFVPVAIIGCDLGNNFIIKASKLRDVESNGMICSSTELGLPKLEDGILVLDESIGELTLGKELSSYQAFCDDIIEIELTPNRGDCLSINGVARELAASHSLKLKEVEKNNNFKETKIEETLEIESADNIDSSLIFGIANIRDFSLPLDHKIKLALAQIYEQNNLKNLLSFTTHSTGVLLDAIAQNSLEAKGNLGILKIKKDKNNLDCICTKDSTSNIGIQSVQAQTEDDIYIFQASYINPELLSQKVFETKAKTGDLYYRSSRGSEPNIEFGLNYAASLIAKFGGQVFAGNKLLQKEFEVNKIDARFKKINSIIGQEIPKAKIENILNSLGFKIKAKNDEILEILIPSFRHDIKNIADIAEEIVRIIGIDNIASKPSQIEETNRSNKVSSNLLKTNNIRAKAIASGFFETITYIFTSKENLQKYGFQTVAEEKDILNPITNELNTYRTTSLLNLVEAVSSNLKFGFKKVAFFEIGTIFDKNRNESKKVSFIFSGDRENESFLNKGKPKSIDFFEFAQKITSCIGEFELEPIEKIENAFIHPYQNATILINGQDAGYITKLHPNVANDYDLGDTFVAQIDFDKIEDNFTKASAYSKFQASKRDLSIIAPKTMSYAQIKKAIKTVENDTIKQFNLVDIYSDEKLDDKQSLTIRFVLQSEHKTLEDEEINASMEQILEALQTKLGIGLR